MPSKSRSQQPHNAHCTLPFPPEIRNEIYNLVLCDPPQRMTILRGKSRGKKRVDTSVLSLLLASKQTFLEAYPLFYRGKLSFPSATALSRFLDRIGHARRCFLTSLSFTYRRDDPVPDGLSLLEELPNLEALEIHLRRWSINVPRLLLHAIEDVRGLTSFEYQMPSLERWMGPPCGVWSPENKLMWRDMAALTKRPRSADVAAISDQVIDPFAKAGEPTYKKRKGPKPVLEKWVNPHREEIDKRGKKEVCPKCTRRHRKNIYCA